MREATRLRSGWLAGIWLFGNGSRTGTWTPLTFTMRVVPGSKICPPMIGRPRASTPICCPVSNALKSPFLNESIGVVLPKPATVPERMRV